MELNYFNQPIQTQKSFTCMIVFLWIIITLNSIILFLTYGIFGVIFDGFYIASGILANIGIHNRNYGYFQGSIILNLVSNIITSIVHSIIIYVLATRDFDYSFVDLETILYVLVISSLSLSWLSMIILCCKKSDVRNNCNPTIGGLILPPEQNINYQGIGYIPPTQNINNQGIPYQNPPVMQNQAIIQNPPPENNQNMVYLNPPPPVQNIDNPNMV